MALRTFKPTTPGQRQLVIIDRSALYRGKPLKSLTEGKISSGGRNNNGRITVRFRGGGHKKALRTVDFKRRKFDQPAKVDLSTISLDLGGSDATVMAKPSGDPKWQEVATKLDLAKAYEEMGDKDGARELLKEVMKDGDAAQRGSAEQLLAKLG